MNRILIPIDFSERSNWAYDLARILAEVDQAELVALAVIPDSSAAYHANNLMDRTSGDDGAEWRNKVKQTQARLLDWAKGKPALTKTDVVIGPIDESIIAYAEEIGARLILMGKHAQVNPDSWSGGSHTVYISNHTAIPVLSLKNDRDLVAFNHVTLVGDFLSHDHLPVGILKKIQSYWGAKLTLLCIRQEDTSRSYADIITDIRAFMELKGIERAEIFVAQGQDIEEEIKAYCEKEGIDLIAIGTHQNKKMSNLFHRSISDELIEDLACPILTIPLHD